MAGAAFGAVQATLFVAVAVFAEVQVSLFVAGAAFGKIWIAGARNVAFFNRNGRGEREK